MNDEWNTMYGLVADAIKQGLFDNMKPALVANWWKLGTMASFQGSGSASDATYHAAIMHDFDEPNEWISRNLASWYLLQAINSSLTGVDVDAVLIGSGIIGTSLAANVEAILKAMDESGANITLYIKPTNLDHSLAMQESLVNVLGEERSRVFLEEANEKDESMLVWEEVKVIQER